MEEPETLAGLDASLTLGGRWYVATVGAYWFPSDDGDLTVAYLAHDLGLHLVDFEDDTWWLILKPVVGVYSWPQAPGDAGLAAGCKLGVGCVGSGDWAVIFEYGWLMLCDTVGESETRLSTGRIAVAWVLE
jgi:hypothetical protein